jgi:hypothetical protein
MGPQSRATNRGSLVHQMLTAGHQRHSQTARCTHSFIPPPLTHCFPPPFFSKYPLNPPLSLPVQIQTHCGATEQERGPGSEEQKGQCPCLSTLPTHPRPPHPPHPPSPTFQLAFLPSPPFTPTLPSRPPLRPSTFTLNPLPSSPSFSHPPLLCSLLALMQLIGVGVDK